MNIAECGYFIRFATREAGLLYNRRHEWFWNSDHEAGPVILPAASNLIGLLCLFPFLMAACASFLTHTCSCTDSFHGGRRALTQTPFQPIGSVNLPTEPSPVPTRLPVSCDAQFHAAGGHAPAPTRIPDAPPLNLVGGYQPADRSAACRSRSCSNGVRWRSRSRITRARSARNMD